MTPGDGPVRSDRAVDFFVSYSIADEDWATWIAGELEGAGYHVMIQAWDFVPGTHFLDFIDRGIREASAVVAILSRSYVSSRYGRLEWLAALRAADEHPPTKLVPVRIEDFLPEGLLAAITFVDLVGLHDPAEARARLLERIQQALRGRAKPGHELGYPRPAAAQRDAQANGSQRTPGAAAPISAQPLQHRVATTVPVYPPTAPAAYGPRESITVLHVAAPRFGRTDLPGGEALGPVERLARMRTELSRLGADEVPRPELLVISGDLTEAGSPTQFGEALSFVTGLRALLGLEPERLVVVPGSHDITRLACQAYFADCAADGIEPQPPYFPKWRHFTRMFGELYQSLDGPTFEASQPWSLFVVPDLAVAIAGLNSTVAETHLPEHRDSCLGKDQADWFAERLAPLEADGYLRIGVVNHAWRDGVPLDDLTDTGIADRLNLLVHGQGAGQAEIAQLPAGVTVVPPPDRSGAQVLQITRDGMARWPVATADAAALPARRRVTRRWHAAHGTFGASRDTGPVTVPVTAETDGVAAPGGVERADDPTTLLLERIAEVCETRYERARIRRLTGQPASLLVTYPDGDLIHQFRVAAHVGRPTEQDLTAFVRALRSTGEDTNAELVYQGPYPGMALLEEALRHGVRLRSFTEFQGLLDLRQYVAGQSERLRSDPIYPPDLYVPQRFREAVGTDASVREDVVEEMLRLLSEDDGRFVLLMGDFGRGKTFAMRRLALELPRRLPEITPILIELRALDKAHSVDGLVAAHLANHGESRIDLRAFRYLLRQGRIALLFDGFDELASRVTYERAASYLNTLLAAMQDDAKIVVASRTQHFQNDAQVRTALGERIGLLPQRRILLLEDFTPNQVAAYLVNRYGEDDEARERLELINTVGDLAGLSRNPRMLSFVAGLDRERLAAVARAHSTMSAAGLYREILQSWLAHEHRRASGTPGGAESLSIDDLWSAVRVLALRLWESDESLLRLDDLAEVAKTLTGLATGRLSTPQAAHAVGAGSLLVRTEEGLFGFIHSSVMEWLLASEIAAQVDSGDPRPPLLSRQPLSQLTVEFLCDLADTQAVAAWAADPGADAVAKANALKVSTRLRRPARLDLRGASLRGEDLCYREMAGVDLTGADMTDARLIGTNLSRAVLRDTRLTRARLDKATLRGADLRGADLTGARLAETDLRETQVAGSRWSRAALVNINADAGLWSNRELADAAKAPGQPVVAGLTPAAVGVSFGFESGRLPRPLAYNNQGTLLAIGSEDGGVLIYDTASGQPVRTLTGHRARVYAVAYDPADRQLVTVGADGTLRFWDAVTGRAGPVLRDLREPIWPLALDGQGRYLAYGDGDGAVWVRRVDSGAEYRVLRGTSERVWAVTFHPEGTLLAAADNSGKVRIWDLGTGTAVHELTFQNVPMYTVHFSPDGTRLAAGGRDGLLRVWDTGSGEPLHTLDGHSGHIYSVAFHPDGTVLASGDTRGGVRLWRVAEVTGRDHTASAQGWSSPGESRSLRGHRGAVYHLTFSPDGALLASGDSDGLLRLWDAETGQERHEVRAHRGALWPVVFRSDSRQLATTGKDSTLRLWDTETGRQRYELHGHGRRITSVRFHADGQMLAVSGNDGVVRLWEPRTGRLLVKPLTGQADQLVSAVFCPKAPLLATTSNDGGVYMWHLGSWQAERELDVGTDHVWAEAFDPDGEVLATANDDDTVRLWWRGTGQEVLSIAEHRGRVRSIEFSPDGQSVATGCDDSAVRLFERATGRCLATLRGHTDRVYAVRFNRDGSLLASVSNDGTARLWDRQTGECRHELRRHRGRLWAGSFSPDGRLLAIAGDDTVIQLWDVATGTYLRSLAGHTRRIWSVHFSPDGKLLASGADDGTTRLWDVADPDHPRLRLTLLGLQDGWAALTPDGRYKTEGTVSGEFWHVLGLCRFELGELDAYLRDVHTVPVEEPF